MGRGLPARPAFDNCNIGGTTNVDKTCPTRTHRACPDSGGNAASAPGVRVSRIPRHRNPWLSSIGRRRSRCNRLMRKAPSTSRESLRGIHRGSGCRLSTWVVEGVSLWWRRGWLVMVVLLRLLLTTRDLNTSCRARSRCHHRACARMVRRD